MAVKYTIELSDDLNVTLGEIAERLHTTKSEVLRKSLALMDVAVSAKDSGKHFGIASAREKLETEIIGL